MRKGTEMARRLTFVLAASALLLAAAGGRAAQGTQCDPPKQGCSKLVSTIAFSSNRDNLTAPGLEGAEIYLMNPDATNVRRLTTDLFFDALANLSPDGKKIVFDSDRLSGQTNVSDLFLMKSDGSEQTFLTQGTSATWSADGKEIAFHASAS